MGAARLLFAQLTPLSLPFSEDEEDAEEDEEDEEEGEDLEGEEEESDEAGESGAEEEEGAQMPVPPPKSRGRK